MVPGKSGRHCSFSRSDGVIGQHLGFLQFKRNLHALKPAALVVIMLIELCFERHTAKGMAEVVLLTDLCCPLAASQLNTT